MNSHSDKLLYGRPALLVDLAAWLIEAAYDAATQKRPRPSQPKSSGCNLTLRPGSDTPLWNELVRQIRPHLRKRGSKAKLARLLGLPRQRLQDCLKAQSASLDAERTLQLIGWLGFFQCGGEIIPVVRPGRPLRGAAEQRLPGTL